MRRDFTLVRGSRLGFTGVARQPDGTVIDLTGATLAWKVGRLNRGSTDTTKTPAVTDATTGKYSASLAGSDTASLSPQWLRHELTVTTSGGEIWTVAEGYIDLRKDMP